MTQAQRLSHDLAALARRQSISIPAAELLFQAAAKLTCQERALKRRNR